MKKEEKEKVVDKLVEKLKGYQIIYLADISNLDSKQSSRLRKFCFKSNLKLEVVKNTLLKRAMDLSDKKFGELPSTLKGNTSLILSEIANAPAKLIKDFRKKLEKPILKGAYIEEAIYIGDDRLDALSNIKSKEEVIGDIVTLLQSPIKRVISSLQSGGSNFSSILKTLSNK